MISKDGCPIILKRCGFKLLIEVMPVEDIITQDERDRIITNKLFTNDKRLSKAIRAWLHFVLNRNAPLRTIAQQALKARCILWCTDDQNIVDPCQHQRTERIIDHWLIIDREQLLTDSHGYRI